MIEVISLEDVKDLSLSIKNDRYAYNGVTVPRVTEIIHKMISEESIIQWANSLGFKHKSYTKTLNEAAVYGTKAHYALECLLKGKQVPLDSPTSIIESFNQWWGTINSNNKVEIIGQEQKLACQYFGGTYDLLLRINGKVYLVDFKTSNHVTYKYNLQLAAYKYMLNLSGIQVDGMIILQLSKSTPGYNEYVLDFSNPEHLEFINLCERCFMSLVYGYYHIDYLGRKFNDYFGRKSVKEKDDDKGKQ